MSELGVSVVIACHSERRWGSLLSAIASAQIQSPPPTEVIVAVDHNPALCSRLRDEATGVLVADHGGTPGASAARNAGAALASSPLIAFLDDDVRAHPGWLRELLAPFRDHDVVGTGGMTVAAWEGNRPRWFPDEFGWVVGASYAGLPTATASVRNVWSENMALRRDAFERVGGFRRGFGKLGQVSRPEDTDLCIRISAAAPGTRWLYVPSARVDHAVPPDRSTVAFFLRRCYWEGLGKIELAAHLGADRQLGDERAYLLRTLPRGFGRALLVRDLARGLAIAAGVGAAGAGAAVGVVRARLSR